VVGQALFDRGGGQVGAALTWTFPFHRCGRALRLNWPGHGEVVVMKAIVQGTYGSAEVLEFRDIAAPEIGDSDVLVRVVAADVDRGALHFMTGQPYLMRILGFGFRSPKVAIPGTNVAGRVEALGKNVSRFHVGDEVYGACRGAFAEYARASQDKLAPKPSSLTFEQAAVVPYGGFAAWQAVHDHGHVAAAQRVLVVGSSGAIGSFAVQLAKVSGAQVTGVCSTRNVEVVRSLGADHVIDYTGEDFADGRVRYDLIIDVFGRSAVSRLRRALTARGRLVIVGGEGDRWIGGIQRQLLATLLSPFVRQKLGAFVVRETARYLLELNPLLEDGRVRPILDRTYPLTQTADAVRHLDSARKAGRMAITVSNSQLGRSA
jgi:NADPH:quinone reductase-like Zn-dependent oxidoreductase